MFTSVAALLLALVVSTPFAGSTTEPALWPAGADVDYQLGGAAPVPDHVGVVVRDRHDEPVPDRVNVCYVNGFQTQPDAKRFWLARRGLLLQRDGRPVVDEQWGEWLLDIRTAARRQRLARIVGRWVDRCAADGFDAVEYDNLDSFTRSGGLLRAVDARRYAALLVERAHAAGLVAGQKNRANWDGRVVGFDFAIAEECGRYRECDAYVASYGERVLMVEYRRADFERTCAGFGADVPVVLRDRDLTPDGVHAWC